MIKATLETLPKTKVKISQAQIDFFRENGYLVVENALDAGEVKTLQRETARICRGELGQVSGLPPFLPEESDDAIVERTLCIHFPHKVSAVMFDFLAQPTIVEVMTGIIGP